MKKLSNVLIFGLLLISSFVVLACPSSANSSPTPAPKVSKTLVKIEVNNPPSSVNVGSTLSLPSAIATYSDNTTETITPHYTSSNSNIASISGKVLTGVSAGTVSVTASYEHEGITKTTIFDITVKDPNSSGDGDVGFNFGDPNSGGNNGDSGDGGIEFDFNN
jgi:hypothetical protein